MDALVNRSYFFEDLEPGMQASITKVVSERDIQQFADVSGDHNPIHLDHTYASATMFKGRISHGLLTASYISAVFGTKMPGPGSVYVSQTLNFKAPVKIDDIVITTVTVRELIARKSRVIFACACAVEERNVLEGEAVLLVPSSGASPD